MKLGRLTLRDEAELESNPRGMLLWDCDCGREYLNTLPIIRKRKNDQNCGKCSQIRASEWSAMKFGSLRMKDPFDATRFSNVKTVWSCDCGRELEARISTITTGHTTSCGKCNILSAEELSTRKFGKLRMRDPKETKPFSMNKEWFVCDCGREKLMILANVTRGGALSCGDCNMVAAETMRTSLFGRLRQRNPHDTYPTSGILCEWDCSCGNIAMKAPVYVMSGRTKSCGKCFERVKNQFNLHKAEIRTLRCPINTEDIPGGVIKPLETIKRSEGTFRAECPICQREYNPNWGHIRFGHAITCGCSYDRISSGHREISEFVRSLGMEAINEFRDNGRNYDIFVPSANLVIEFNGLAWHAGKEARSRDVTKYESAKSVGRDYIMIFEDEWVLNRPKVETLLSNRIRKSSPIRLRPSKCEIRKITSSEADPFYSVNHYIGACQARVNYGIFFEGKLIACASFKKPTRQSSHDWELVRMSSSPEYQVRGIWSKILGIFSQEFAPTSIVSFSDNRLFNGGVYEKIGFRFDGELKPDYYWARSGKRHHKSTLRKPPGCQVTEVELRESEGYKRIWDLGKKRWVFTPAGFSLQQPSPYSTQISR